MALFEAAAAPSSSYTNVSTLVLLMPTSSVQAKNLEAGNGEIYGSLGRVCCLERRKFFLLPRS